jgi:predicted DNA-binding transcriptional regulator AlpA
MPEPYIKYIHTLTIDEFKTILHEFSKSFLKEMKSDLQESFKKETNLVNIKVIMEKLQVTKPTIYNWKKKGIIKPEKVGGKVYYDLQAILRDTKQYDGLLRRGDKYFDNRGI